MLHIGHMCHVIVAQNLHFKWRSCISSHRTCDALTHRAAAISPKSARSHTHALEKGYYIHSELNVHVNYPIKRLRNRPSSPLCLWRLLEPARGVDASRWRCGARIMNCIYTFFVAKCVYVLYWIHVRRQRWESKRSVSDRREIDAQSRNGEVIADNCSGFVWPPCTMRCVDVSGRWFAGA